MAETRSERIETAARATAEIAECVCHATRHPPCYVCALRSALALPPEESEEGWIARYTSEPLLSACSDGVWEMRVEPARNAAAVHVRVSVIPEEGA